MTPVNEPTRTKGVIHDVGYARYVGARRPPSSNWWVIARQQIAFAWSTWWRWKLALILTLVITVAAGAVLYLSQDKLGALVTEGGNHSLLDKITIGAMSFYRIPAFITTMTMTAMLVARDMETGAFSFYFARPVRPLDYVLGKLVGMTIVMGCMLLAAPLLLALFRVAMAQSLDAARDALPLVGIVALIGTLGSLAFAVIPMALSALLGKRWLALGLWAGYYLPIMILFMLIGAVSWPPMMSIDPAVALEVSAFRLAEIAVPEPQDRLGLTAALVGLTIHIVVATAIFTWRVVSQATSSVGASS